MADTNYESLSDKELADLVAKKQQGMAAPKDHLDAMSDEELSTLVQNKMAKTQQPQEQEEVDFPPPTPKTAAEKVTGFLGKIAKPIGKIGEKLDPYIFGPTRAAIAKAQEGDIYEAMQRPGLLNKAVGVGSELIGHPVEAAISQFGTRGAPTSKDIAAKAGLSTQEIPMSQRLPFLYSETPGQLQFHKGGAYDPGVSTAGLIGGAAESVIPAGMSAAGLLGKAGKAVTSVAGKLGRAKNIGLLEDVGAVGKGIEKFPVKAESILGTIPEHNIEVFRERYPEVQEIRKKFSGNPLEASEDLRTRLSNDLQNAKNQANGKIDSFLKDTENKKLGSVETETPINIIEKNRGGLTETLDKSARDELKTFRNEIESFDKNKNGHVNARNAWDLYKKFKQRAQGSYLESGDVYTNPANPDISRTAKELTRYFGDKLKEISPNIKDALDTHSAIHDAEDVLATNLLERNASPNGIYRAGTFLDEPARAALKEVQGITGTDYVRDAENIAAMRALYDQRAPHGHAIMRTIGRPIIKGYERATQPGLIGGFPGGDGVGYGDTVRGLVRGARIKEQNRKKDNEGFNPYE